MPASTERHRVLAAMAVIYFVWGSTYVGLKVGVRHLPALTLSSVRFLLAGLLLYAWCAWRRGRRPVQRWRPPTAAQWRACALEGLLLPAAGTGGAGWAEQRLPSGTTALLLATIPLWIAVGKRLFDKEKLHGHTAVGLVAGFVGVAVLVNPFGGPAPDPLSTGVALTGALCWGLGSVYGTHADHPEQPFLASAMQMISAGVALAVLAAVRREDAGQLFAASSGRSIAALMYLIVFGSVLAYSCYGWLLRHAPARIVGTYAFVNPLVAVVLGWWLLSEPVTARTALAGLGIVCGVFLIVLPGTRTIGPAADRGGLVRRTRRSALVADRGRRRSTARVHHPERLRVCGSKTCRRRPSLWSSQRGPGQWRQRPLPPCP